MPALSLRVSDGVELAYSRSGAGPALVLVHGNLSDGRYFARLAPLLEDAFTLVALDRRGHGASGEGPVHSLERDARDVAAVAALVGGRVALLGHSYGATVALAAAPLLGDALTALVLYEPSPGWAPDDPAIMERMDGLVAAGDREGAVRAFFREGLHLSEEEWRAIRDSPRWPGRLLDEAHTIPREWRAESGYEDFARPAVPALLLAGTVSPVWAIDGTKRVAAALPRSRVHWLAGEGHDGCRTSAGAVAAAVRAFLAGV